MGILQPELCPHRPGRWTELEAPCGEEGWWGGVQGREGEGCFIFVSSRRARLLWGCPSALPLTLCRPCPCCVLRGRLSALLSPCPVFAGPRSCLLFPPGKDASQTRKQSASTQRATGSSGLFPPHVQVLRKLGFANSFWQVAFPRLNA